MAELERPRVVDETYVLQQYQKKIDYYSRAGAEIGIHISVTEQGRSFSVH